MVARGGTIDVTDTPQHRARCERVLEAHLRAANAHDVAAILDTFGEHGALVLNGQRFVGGEQIRRAHEEFGFGGSGTFSDLRLEVKTRHATSEAIILEQQLTGRHTGAWSGLSATGKAVEVAVCTVYTFDAQARIAEERVYFDGTRLLAQVGVQPPRPSRRCVLRRPEAR